MNQAEMHSQAQSLLRTLAPLRELTVSQAMSLLEVALDEGRTVNDYAKRAAISPTTMSRHLLDLGDRTRKMAPGLGLVEGRDNIMNRREKIYGLTPKGRTLLAKAMGRVK